MWFGVEGCKFGGDFRDSTSHAGAFDAGLDSSDSGR